MLKMILLSLICLLSFSHADFSFSDAPPAEYQERPKSIPAKQVIIQNRKEITALKSRISDLEERIDGLTSLLEGLNATVSEMQMRSPSLSSNVNGSSTMSGADNTKLIKELGVMIDKINSDYVSKDELAKVLDGKKNLSTNSKAEPKSSLNSSSLKSNTKPSQSTASIYSEGVRLFVKQRYDEAEKRFKITDSKGYKPAASNYYLGEIAYYTKHYEDAIFYFKKSASLYDKASYIDVLLLHTAISLDNIGSRAEAKVFYKNVIENYPDRKTAKIAREKLKRH